MPHYGLFGNLFVFFFIIGVSVDDPGGGVPSFGCMPICLRISSGDGIPGVGVTPGFIGFFISSGLGMPGVGVAPLGTLIGVAGIPGVGVPVIGTGLVDRPGGRLLLSNVTAWLELTLALFAGADPQAAKKVAAVKRRKSAKILIISTASREQKYLCRFRGCVPGGQRRRPNRHRKVKFETTADLGRNSR